MGVTFIGNPFDQDNDTYDSDWDANLDEEWVTAPQVIALVDVMDRAQFNLILAAGAESSGEESDPNWLESYNDDDSDEDYNPDPEDYFVSENEMVDMISEPDQFPIDSDDSEDIDYVTYPLNDPVEPDKTTSDTSNNRENNDAD